MCNVKGTGLRMRTVHINGEILLNYTGTKCVLKIRIVHIFAAFFFFFGGFGSPNCTLAMRVADSA